MTAPRLGFVKLIVRDMAVAESFYADAFAMTRTGTFETDAIEEVILRGAGGASLVLYHWKDSRPLTLGSAHGPIGFYVDDVDASFATALACGGTAERQPVQFGKGIRAAFVADPDGHSVELIKHDRVNQSSAGNSML